MGFQLISPCVFSILHSSYYLPPTTTPLQRLIELFQFEDTKVLPAFKAVFSPTLLPSACILPWMPQIPAFRIPYACCWIPLLLYPRRCSERQWFFVEAWPA